MRLYNTLAPCRGRLFIAFALCLLAPVFSSFAAEQKPIVVPVGQEFERVLESSSANDSQWLLARPRDEVHLKQAGREYKSSNRPNTRTPGFEVLRYKAVAEGKTQIHLKYASLWKESQAPARSTNFVIVITNSATRPQK